MLSSPITKAQEENLTYVDESADTSLVRRVRPEELSKYFHGKIMQETGIDIMAPAEGTEKVAEQLQKDIKYVINQVRKEIVWGVFSQSGRLRKMFEVGQVRRLHTQQDAKAFKNLFLSGLKDEPEKFGSSFTSVSQQPMDEIHKFLNQNYVVGVSHSYGFNKPSEPALHKLVGIGAVMKEEGKRRHIATMGKLYVRKEHRLRGLGQQLAEDRLTYVAGQSGIMQVNIIVTATNKRVIEWYQKMGFEKGEIMPNQMIVDGQSYDWVPLYLDLGEYRHNYIKSALSNA